MMHPMMRVALLAAGGAQPEVFGPAPVASVVTPADLPSGGEWSSWRLDGYRCESRAGRVVAAAPRPQLVGRAAASRAWRIRSKQSTQRV
ncbi:MAG: hypothetical protein H6703_00245 [Myxococcales bacterium]|nr:hypothetical protein [Myxococcales bacterium]